MDNEPFRVAVGILGPPVEDTIIVNDKPYPLTTADVDFYCRFEDNDYPTIAGPATIVDATTAQVKYVWQSGDTDAIGFYKAWWHVTDTNIVFDTDEFDLEVFAHAPGGAVRTGLIAKRVRSYIPETIAAMIHREKFSYEDLQFHIDVVKSRVFGTIVPAEDEADTYSLAVIDYLARVTTIKLIPAAVDFWNNTLQSQAVTGTNEQQSYGDRKKGLEDIRKMLMSDLSTTTLTEVDGEWTVQRRHSNFVPAVSINHTNLIMPDPYLCEAIVYDPTRGVIPPRWPALPAYP